MKELIRGKGKEMRLKYGIFIMVAILLLTGCKKDEINTTDISENVVSENVQEEVNETTVSENEPGVSLNYVENYLEEEGEIVDFLKNYFMISCKEDLEILTQMPLTESFFNSCVNDFEYPEEADITEFVYVAAWMKTNETEYDCLVRTYDFLPQRPYNFDSDCLSSYSVKVTLIGNQIDQVLVEKFGWPEETNSEETDRREYTQEDKEAAWESRLGNYGLALSELPELKECEEVFEMCNYDRTCTYKLTIHSFQLEEPEYVSINAGIAELVEAERRYWGNLLYRDEEVELLVSRMDGRVISIRSSEYRNILDAVTFDMATGEKLSCADIFADANTAEAIIAEKLVEELQTAGADRQMIRNAEYFSLESVEGYHWYLDEEGVVITVGTYHGYSIVLPYREYAYLIQPQYLPE